MPDTPKPSTMDDLIAKLEAASEGSRELADEVLFACGWQTNFEPEEIDEVHRNGRQIEDEDGTSALLSFADFMNCACWYPPGEKPFSGKWIEGHYRPDPTSSLDAAVMLVPEGIDWTARTRREHPYHGIFPAEAVVWQGRQSGFAMTPPLALCIAALKARSAQ